MLPFEEADIMAATSVALRDGAAVPDPELDQAYEYVEALDPTGRKQPASRLPARRAPNPGRNPLPGTPREAAPFPRAARPLPPPCWSGPGQGWARRAIGAADADTERERP